MITRFRVAGITLAAHSRRRTTFLSLPQTFRSFVCADGADIRLDLSEEPPPKPDPAGLLFDSGAVWRVYRSGSGFLYTFSTSLLDPPLYKAVEIDRALRRGTLYYPRPREGRRPPSALSYPLDELLFQHRFAREGSMEVHACGIVVNGRAVLFCGHSGAGKTTMAKLWRRHRPEDLILSDDRVIVRPGKGGLWAYGTPWHGEGCFGSPEGRPVGAVFFLRHAKRTVARRLEVPAAASRLFVRTFPPLWDRDALKTVLDTCSRLAMDVPCYDLGVCPGKFVVDVVRGLMESST
jgi:hypothetical protein